MITFSHNHCGPRLGDDLVDYYPVEAEQVEAGRRVHGADGRASCVAMVGEALANLAPASLQIGEGKATFAVNRRNNREADVPALLAKGEPLEGPVDHAVPVMTVTRPGRQASRRSSSATPATRRRSASPSGAATIRASPSSRWRRTIPARRRCSSTPAAATRTRCRAASVELCEKYGQMLADAVEEALKKPLKPVSPALRTAFEYVDLPYQKVVTREELQAALEGRRTPSAHAGRRGMLQEARRGREVRRRRIRIRCTPGGSARRCW